MGLQTKPGMAAIRNDAKLYLIEKKVIDLEDLKASKPEDLPAKIAVRSHHPRLVRQRKHMLLLFVEAYARYLFFTSEKQFPGLVEKCQRFQKMRKGRSKEYAGLIRCILGLKPKGLRAHKRKKVSEFYVAFRRLKKSRVYPAHLAESGDCLSDILHPSRKGNGQTDARTGSASSLNSQSVLFGICVYRKSSKGQMTIKKDLAFDVDSEKEALQTFEAANKFWRVEVNWEEAAS